MHLSHKLPAFLYCAESEGVRVVCPFIERPIGEYVDVATPYGFSGFAGNGDFPELPSYWDQFVRSRGYVSAFIALHPLFFRPCYTRAEETHELKALYFLNPALGREELLRHCSEKRRLFLRKWEKSGIRIITDRTQLVRFALENYRGFFERKMADASYDLARATLQFLLPLHSVLLTGAAQGDEIEAFHLAACTPYVAESLFYFDLPDADPRCIGLDWEAVKRLQAMGIGAFSLGGGRNHGDTIDEFKRRFGGESRPLRALKQVIRPEVYAQLCAGSAGDANERDGYFPPIAPPPEKVLPK
jgi:hypothetical protein